MNEQENSLNHVWVFNGINNHFPSGVFTEKRAAEEWIEKNNLSGTLTEYPINVSAYDWAVENGYFKPKREEHFSASFIANFTSSAQKHYHYGDEEKH